MFTGWLFLTAAVILEQGVQLIFIAPLVKYKQNTWNLELYNKHGKNPLFTRRTRSLNLDKFVVVVVTMFAFLVSFLEIRIG